MWNIKNKEAVSPVIGVILMVAITVVLAAVLYVWVSGFMTTTTGGVYAISTGSWSGSTNNLTASVSVISTTPSSGIKWSDITWQLYNVTGTAIETTATLTWSATTQTGGPLGTGEYLKAGCTVTVTRSTAAVGTHDFKARAIIGGSQAYESPTFTF